MRIKIRSSVDLYTGCVYVPAEGNVIQVCTNMFNLLDEDNCMFQSAGRVLLLGDFNARGGKSDDVDDKMACLGRYL